MAQPPRDGPAGKVNEKVVQAVINAFYPAVLGSADAARTRAQNGYTIASAVAAAIVAAGVSGGFASTVLAVKILGVVALVLWLAAAAGYIYAVAGRVPSAEGIAIGPDQFTLDVVQKAREAREKVEGRASVAQYLTFAAVVATAAALGLAALFPHKSTTATAHVLLSKSGAADVARLCSTRSDVIEAKVEPEAVGKTAVVVTPVPTACGNHEPTLHLLGKDVVAVADGAIPEPAKARPSVVQVELTAHGRAVVDPMLGRRCRVDDLRGRLLGGGHDSQVVLAFARRACRRWPVLVTHDIGTILHLAPTG